MSARSDAGFGAIGTLKSLDVDDVGMTLRAPFNGVLSLVPHALIESWGLEAVRRENNLSAAAGDSLGFGRMKEKCSESSPSVLLVHPDMREFATSSPCVAVEARDDFAGIAPDATGQEHAVDVSRFFRIELVDPIGQDLGECLALGLISD